MKNTDYSEKRESLCLRMQGACKTINRVTRFSSTELELSLCGKKSQDGSPQQFSGYYFSAPPAGNYNGSYNNFGNNANFWSATENSSNNAYKRNLIYNNANVNSNNVSPPPRPSCG